MLRSSSTKSNHSTGSGNAHIHKTGEEMKKGAEKLRRLASRNSIDFSNHDNIRDICQKLILSDSDCRELMKRMNDCFDKGLHPDTAKNAAVKMLPSYVRAVSNGTERGDFLALDLGGTNFRVLLITLDGKENPMHSKIFRVPDSLMKGKHKTQEKRLY
uniref:Phosphotransferase n=1 Tax=Rhabditophanes sp. KR3021 TaxID=114890 RepID=A0AC35U977_9BILA